MEKYLSTGEIWTAILTEAVLCEETFKGGVERLRRLPNEVLEYYKKYLPALKLIAIAGEDIQTAARAFEKAVWLPTIQPYYAASETRGHSGIGNGFKALLWGSAGRVLLTIQDIERHGLFNGAWVTLIFDETAKEPRGGVQGLCATRDEAVDILRAATDGMPALSPDSNVTIW
jgi:hypothetical protein